MIAHTVSIESVSEGVPAWGFQCLHAQDDHRWYVDNDECWLWSWWDNIGAELLDLTGPVTTLPLPVRPSPDWSLDNGGTIINDPQPVGAWT